MQPWWKELEGEIRREENLELDSKLGKTINKALDLVNDRLENGDIVYNHKTGKSHRVPAKLRDITSTTTGLFDKRQILRKNPEEKTQHQQQFEDRLLKLAEQFAAFALGKPKENNEKVIEGEVITDAVYEEWKEGLPSGTSLGAPKETEPSEGSGVEEQGEEHDDEEGGEDRPEGERRRTQNSGGPWWFESDVQPNDSISFGKP
jgi:hypothetical protein